MTTDLEERLRRDLTTFAGRATADEYPRPAAAARPGAPAGAAETGAGWHRPARRSPLPAVIAAAALIAGADHSVHRRATGPVASATAPEPGMPRFYVVVLHTRSWGQKIPTIAAVHRLGDRQDAREGAGADAVFEGGGAGTAPGSARRLTTAPMSSPSRAAPGGGGGSQAKFYLLRVAASGRSATVKQLPISWPRTLAPDQQAALSPDGTQLAMDVQACYVGGCHYSGVRVITIATGAVRSWTTHVQGAPFQLSWAGNSAHRVRVAEQ